MCGQGGALDQLQRTAESIQPDLQKPAVNKKRKALVDASDDLSENQMASPALKKQQSKKVICTCCQYFLRCFDKLS